jgi:uncharacterized protein (DUF1499 family)
MPGPPVEPDPSSASAHEHSLSTAVGGNARKRWRSRRAVIGALFLASVLGVLWNSNRWQRDMAQANPRIGVTPSGTLRPCPDTPNCVVSFGQAGERRMDPLPWEGDSEAGLDRLEQLLARFPRTQVITRQNGYLHVEFRSLLFRFVDDVEFLVAPEEHCIHFRSASRVGHSDLGANQQRMAAIQRAWNEMFAAEPDRALEN